MPNFRIFLLYLGVFVTGEYSRCVQAYSATGRDRNVIEIEAVETLYYQQRNRSGSGGTFRVAINGVDGGLRDVYHQTAPVASGMAVSGGLDHSVYLNGNQCGEGMAYQGQRCTKHWIKPLCSTADRQLFLESDFLQCPGVRICGHLASAFMVLVLLMILQFYKVDKLAALMQIPYLIWLTFAAYLNIGVWYLNP